MLLFASGPFHGEISTLALALMPSFVLAIQSGYVDLTNGWGGGEMVGKTIIGGKTFLYCESNETNPKEFHTDNHQPVAKISYSW